MQRLIILAICSLFFSCSTVRVVKSQPGKGGELSIQNGFIGDPASTLAERVMTANCPSGYVVVEEGEQVIGSTSRSSGSEDNKGSILDKKSSKSTSSETSTQDVTEWRMKYKCKKSKQS